MIVIKFTIREEGNRIMLQCDGHDKDCCTLGEERFCKAFIKHVNAMNTDYETLSIGIRMKRLGVKKLARRVKK